ncbi:MAG TPA: asparagine synthase (glutamine-hydrolyzing) [Nitrospirales bacterium]|nr:asparagine synthase (glutamine-hydrolyzing) [Nitrospirales bacterium]
MCGIAGLLGEFKDRRTHLSRMLNALVHRGPDEKGEYIDKLFAGGMRRLSINDLQGGSQPLFNHDKSIVLLYNGEIYNSGELRQELEAAGKRFRTRSDGEVIAHLYEDLGEYAFERLDGMFAVALWDSRRKRLLLARDLPGEKPLYFARLNHGQLVFASEVKALEHLSLLSLTLDRQAIWDFPSFLWIPEPSSVYNEIEALPRGHILVACDGDIRIGPYRDRFVSVQLDIATDERAVGSTRRIVEDAIKSRLLSDVPVGSFLSGGLDSSVVATIAARELPRLDTFTVSFEDIDDPYHGRADESKAAAHTAAAIGSRHHVVHVTAESFRKSLDTFCQYGDLPFSVSSGLGILAVSAAAREAGIKVLLTGDGADECFGGYSWYEHLAGIKRINGVLPCTPVSFQNVGLSLQERLTVLRGMSPSRRAWAWHYYADETEKLALFSPEWGDGLRSSLCHFQALEQHDTPEEFIRHDRDFYFPNEMLRKVDRMAMAYSVEGRTPFAAPSVRALADRLSLNHMVRGTELKWVLRRAFEDILPRDVVNRPKHGFNVPIDHWLQGEWADMVDEAFQSGSALQRNGIVASNSLLVARRLLADRERLNGHTIFSFIMLNKWLSR